jgi:hypothetical protein
MPSKNLNEEDKIFADIMKMISKSNKKDSKSKDVKSKNVKSKNNKNKKNNLKGGFAPLDGKDMGTGSLHPVDSSIKKDMPTQESLMQENQRIATPGSDWMSALGENAGVATQMEASGMKLPMMLGAPQQGGAAKKKKSASSKKKKSAVAKKKSVATKKKSVATKKKSVATKKKSGLKKKKSAPKKK